MGQINQWAQMLVDDYDLYKHLFRHRRCTKSVRSLRPFALDEQNWDASALLSLPRIHFCVTITI